MPGEFDWSYIETGPEVWRVEIRRRPAEAGSGEAEALALLLREHREMESHLQASREWRARLESQGEAAIEPQLEQLQTFGRAVREDLALHIAHEDRALFPVLARHIGDQSGPIAVMLMEHRHLEREERQFQDALERRDARRMAEVAAEIDRVLSAHIMKEESVLFPLARRVLTAAEWQEVLERIRNQG